jgi:hypothetical protein
MQHSRTAWLVLTLAASLGAQTFRVPAPGFVAGESNIPLAASPSRYQQWFSAAQLQATVRVPVRMRAMAFLAGSVLQPGRTVDIEIRMALLAPNTFPSTTFDNNLLVNNTLVFARSNVTLVAQPMPGARVFTFPFAREFPWDGRSAIVFDLKVFGNGNNNNSYLYHCATTVSSPSQTIRLFAPGNPGGLAMATTVQNGQGLVTEFDYVDGLTVSYGAGCPGTGAAVPMAGTTGGLPIPPNPAFTLTLGNTLPLAATICVMGSSQTFYGAISLPFDLGLIGFPGCALRTDPLVYFPANASAAGTALLPFPLPGVTLRRRELFMQWFVLDPGAPNGALAASQGLWTVFG